MQLYEKFIRLKPVAAILRALHPSYGVCLHCGVPFSNIKRIHSIKANESEGFFAVCEHCYEHISDQELEDAYRRLWNEVWKNERKPFYYVVFRNAYIKDIKARHK